MNITRNGILAAISFTAFLASSAVSYGQYTLVKVGNSGYGTPALNNHDQVTLGAMVWSAGTTTTLSGLEDGFTFGRSINDSAQIVGSVRGSDFVTRATLWQNGVRTFLPPLVPNYSSYAAGINDRGEIVGYAEKSNRELTAVVWKTSTSSPVEIGALPGDQTSFGLVINIHGTVAGLSKPSIAAGFGLAGFKFDGGQLSQLGPMSLRDMTVRDINGKGIIVGYQDGAAYFFDKEMHAFGGPASAANGINEYGEIVGYTNDDSNIARPFLYKNGVMIDLASIFRSQLPDFDVENSSVVAWDINDKGDIVLSDQFNNVYLATADNPHPIPGLSPVPEPASFGLFAAFGLFGLTALKRRKCGSRNVHKTIVS